jgi:hypothetical protein
VSLHHTLSYLDPVLMHERRECVAVTDLISRPYGNNEIVHHATLIQQRRPNLEKSHADSNSC